jgi:hypothetical protein
MNEKKGSKPEEKDPSSGQEEMNFRYKGNAMNGVCHHTAAHCGFGRRFIGD